MPAALLGNKGAHLHGIAVLSRDWFLYQLPYQENEVKLEAFSGNALARLIGKLVDEISGMQMLPASLHRYLHLDKTSNNALKRTREPPPKSRHLDLTKEEVSDAESRAEEDYSLQW